MMYSAASGAPPPWQMNGKYSQQNGHPAYISVATRNPYASQSPLPPLPTYAPPALQSHAPPTSLATASSPSERSAPQRKKIEWPPSVREYVNRCFDSDNQILGIQRPDMEKKLRQIITEAAQSNNLNSLDWQKMPLPQQLIQEERNRVVLAPQPVPVSYIPPIPVSFPSGGQGHYSQSEVLRKRKSSELGAEANDSVQPPWRSSKGSGSLEDRVTFPDKRQKLEPGKPSSKSNANLEQRKKRFEDARSGSNSPRKSTFVDSSPAPAEMAGPVVGLSEKLEKNYFRLTSAPNPGDVRPLHILRQTLELLKKKWRQESNYTYICDQFKSLRQDLTVQHIKNDFTTNVYEIHARIALEKGDLGEYNQCQTQLRALYKQNLGGHPTEFMAYRILYFIHTCNRTDMNDVLSDLTTADKAAPAIRHALEVRSALALGNYHKFFKLYLDPPNMGAYLMDMFIERERLAAMARMCKSYKPDVKLRFITEELAFESDEESAQFMLAHEAGALLQEKDGHVRLLTGKAGPLFEEARQAAFRHVDIKGQI